MITVVWCIHIFLSELYLLRLVSILNYARLYYFISHEIVGGLEKDKTTGWYSLTSISALSYLFDADGFVLQPVENCTNYPLIGEVRVSGLSQHMVQVIPHKTGCVLHRDHSVVFARWRLYTPHLIHVSLGQQSLFVKWHLYRFIHFCRGHQCVQHTGHGICDSHSIIIYRVGFLSAETFLSWGNRFSSVSFMTQCKTHVHYQSLLSLKICFISNENWTRVRPVYYYNTWRNQC